MGGPTLDGQFDSRITLSLVRDEVAPWSARHALDTLDHGLDYQREYAVKLLLSELVTNAVKYGGDGPVRVEIELIPPRVRVEVIDDGPGFTPTRRSAELDAVGGWGLVLVEELASRWGRFNRGTHLWFEIDADVARAA